jgi:hypothetical protein
MTQNTVESRSHTTMSKQQGVSVDLHPSAYAPSMETSQHSEVKCALSLTREQVVGSWRWAVEACWHAWGLQWADAK